MPKLSTSITFKIKHTTKKGMARRRQVSQSFMDENEKSWVDVLPHKEVFTYLREKSDPVASVSGNILCTLRGDLFIWCQAVCEMLTFNLMQLSAYPQKDIYQVGNLYTEFFNQIGPKLIPKCPD